MQGDARTAGWSLLAWLVATGCGVAPSGPADDLEGGIITAGLDGGDAEPQEPPADGDDEPSEPQGTEVPLPSCETLGCPGERPYCGDEGRCLECRNVFDCEASSCDSGECQPLPDAGRIAWFQADTLPLGPVDHWASAGGGASAVQDDAALQPVVEAMGSTAAVWFDGVDDRLTIEDDGAFGSASAKTVVAVIVADADGQVFGSSGPESTGSVAVQQGRPQVAHAGGDPLWPSRHLVAGTPRIISVRAEQTGTALWLEDSLAAVAEIASSEPSQSVTTVSMGAPEDGSLPPFAGGIAELLVFDRALDDAELEQIHRYLAERHALTEPDPWATLSADVSIFYPLDEVGGGVRNDTLGNLPIIPFPSAEGTVAVPGMVGQAQHVDGANGEFHFWRDGSDPRLDHSTTSFTWAGWVAIDPLEPVDPYLEAQTLVSKWDPPYDCQFRVWYEPSARTWSLSVSPTGAEEDAVTLTHPRTVDEGEFALVEAWRDAMTGQLGLRVSAPGTLGEAVTMPMSQPLPVLGNDLNVAAHATCSDGFLQGTIDALGQWHRPLTERESAVLVDGYEPG